MFRHDSVVMSIISTRRHAATQIRGLLCLSSPCFDATAMLLSPMPRCCRYHTPCDTSYYYAALPCHRAIIFRREEHRLYAPLMIAAYYAMPAAIFALFAAYAITDYAAAADTDAAVTPCRHIDFA